MPQKKLLLVAGIDI